MDAVRAALPDARLGIHTHNDSECGVANSLAAVDSGARLVQGTINGYGERCGNANLVSIIPALALKMGYEALTPDAMARADSDLALRRRDGQRRPGPLGALRRAATPSPTRAECTSPACSPTPAPSSTSTRELVGNGRNMVVSELSGRGTIISRARDLGIDLEGDPDKVQQILARIKELEHLGLPVRSGRRELRDAHRSRDRRPQAALHPGELPRDHRAAGRRCGDDRGDHQDWSTMASGSWQRARATAPSTPSTPPCAAPSADRVPALAEIELDQLQGPHPRRRPRAPTPRPGCSSSRVIAPAPWGSVGVNENVIAASWEALIDSLEHGVRRVVTRGGASTAR